MVMIRNDLRAKRSFSEQFTFARNSDAYAFGRASRGLMRFSEDKRRLDIDPKTGLIRGLLIEQQSELLALHSGDLTNAAWVKGDLTVDAQAEPKFIGGAFLLTADATTAEHKIHQASLFTNDGVVRSGFKLAFKAGTHGVALLTFRHTSLAATGYIDLATGEITNDPNGHTNADQVRMVSEDIGDGWFMVTITGVPDGGVSTASSMTIAIPQSVGGAVSWNAAGTETILVAVPRAEEPVGDYVSSYMPTTTAPVTREADDLDNAVETQWGVPRNYKVSAIVSSEQDGVIYQEDDGTEDNRVRFARVAGDLHFIVTAAGVDQADINLGALTDFAKFTATASIGEDDIAASLNGATAVTDNVASMPTGITTRRYGRDTAGNYLNGWMRLANSKRGSLSGKALEAA